MICGREQNAPARPGGVVSDGRGLIRSLSLVVTCGGGCRLPAAGCRRWNQGEELIRPVLIYLSLLLQYSPEEGYMYLTGKARASFSKTTFPHSFPSTYIVCRTHNGTS